MVLNVEGVAFTSGGTTLSMDAATNWMQVNANGILTRPQCPYMRGQLAGKGVPYNAAATGGTIMVTADDNFGGCWNNATGLFTCPITSHYMMTLGAIANLQAGYCHLMKNGVSQHYTHWNHMGNWHYVSLSGIISCASGDALSFYMNGFTPGSNGFYGDGGHGMYSIAMM